MAEKKELEFLDLRKAIYDIASGASGDRGNPQGPRIFQVRGLNGFQTGLQLIRSVDLPAYTDAYFTDSPVLDYDLATNHSNTFMSLKNSLLRTPRSGERVPVENIYIPEDEEPEEEFYDETGLDEEEFDG